MYYVLGVTKFTASFPTHRNWDGRQTCQRKKGTGKCQMPRKLMSKEGGGRWKGTGPMEQVKRLRACLHSDAISPSLWIPQHFAWACPDLGCCPLILTAAVRASVLHSPHWCAHLNQALLPATPSHDDHLECRVLCYVFFLFWTGSPTRPSHCRVWSGTKQHFVFHCMTPCGDIHLRVVPLSNCQGRILRMERHQHLLLRVTEAI